MEVGLDVQREVDALPEDEEILAWVKEVLVAEKQDDTELTVRIVSREESAGLNEQYRNKKGPTNVLSFPFEAPAEVDINLLGDLVICSDVVVQQAKEQHKQELAHWAHIIIHGTLHLLGYDHLTDDEANVMETKEITILSQLGYPDPYREIET
jgi:probable rRNA maturation factor